MALLFSSELTTPEGPPPQAVLNQRPLWWMLILLLFATLMLRMAIFDFIGGLLCSLLLLVAYLIVHDGMKNVGKFSLLFGLLCGLNFFFYFIPFITNVITGRSERHIVPVEATNRDGLHELTYVLTVKTYAFFDLGRGILYNAQSAGMMAMPVCMLFGLYLGLSAHLETFRNGLSIYGHDDDDDSEYGIGPAEGDASLNAAAHRQRLGAVYGAISNLSQHPNACGSNPVSPFQGKAHKLLDA